MAGVLPGVAASAQGPPEGLTPWRSRERQASVWYTDHLVGFRYVVQTFGCQMNVHDSSRMEDVLRASGGVVAPRPDDADLIVFNTCSVREKAEQKLRSEVGLLARIRHVDLVLGPDNIPELPALLMEQMAGSPPVSRTEFDLDAPRFLTASPVVGGAPVVALVTTMKGCDERCSFCVVPYTRGPERYRTAREVVDEATRFVMAGSREILLLGQTVDSFRDPNLPPAETDPAARAGTRPGDESQFAHLLRLIAHEVPLYDDGNPEAPGL